MEDKKMVLDNLDLFIGAYKSFVPPVKNKSYKIIVGNHDVEFKDTELDVIRCGNKDDLLDDMFYSEIYMLKKLIDMDYPFKEYVGFCHYRKYFKFMDDIPDLDEIFKKSDCIVGYPLFFKNNLKETYGKCHNGEDLEIVEGIIKDKFPDYAKSFDKTITHSILIPYNMFIMKRDNFKECIEFIWSVLGEYINIVGRNIYKRIIDNKDKYIKRNYPNSTIEYQYRIGGYLAERLTNVYIAKNFETLKTYGITLTEEKYKK